MTPPITAVAYQSNDGETLYHPECTGFDLLVLARDGPFAWCLACGTHRPNMRPRIWQFLPCDACGKEKVCSPQFLLQNSLHD